MNLGRRTIVGDQWLGKHRIRRQPMPHRLRVVIFPADERAAAVGA